MTILFAGKKGFEYNRTRILLAGLKKIEGVELLEYQFGKKDKETGSKLAELSRQADFVFVPSFRHSDVGFVKRHTNTPVVFDPLISNYLTKVVDYGHYWKAPVKYLSDYLPMKRCDLLIADTDEHKDYFHNVFGIPKSKIHVVPVGVDTAEFYPQKAVKWDKFKVGFYGTFNPLQGVETIIEVAKLLKDHEDIKFEIIGHGATYADVRAKANEDRLRSILFHEWLPYEKLSETLNSFDLCLGIFGDSKKANMVVPNKIFHYAALGKAIITKDTPAIRGLFEADQEIVLTSTKPFEIAEKIVELKSDLERAKRIGNNALERIRAEYDEVSTAKSLIQAMEQF